MSPAGEAGPVPCRSTPRPGGSHSSGTGPMFHGPAAPALCEMRPVHARTGLTGNAKVLQGRPQSVPMGDAPGTCSGSVAGFAAAPSGQSATLWPATDALL